MYSFKFEQKHLEIIQNRKIELDTAILQKIVVNSTMPQNASLIIYTLTHINGGNPLIAPPNFCKKHARMIIQQKHPAIALFKELQGWCFFIRIITLFNPTYPVPATAIFIYKTSTR